MPLKRVTMQDIADACGLSRNTVSKIFNGRGSVPEATRRMVLSKAQELGYAQLPEESIAQETSNRNIALLTQPKLLGHGFGSYFLTSFTDQISRSGYTMKMYEISAEEIEARRLPPHLVLEDTAGFLGIELFDRAYLEMICSLQLPTVFVDGYAHASQSLMHCDFVSMENCASEQVLVEGMLRAGAKRIGFVGDIEHCNSFYERWCGYCAAMDHADLPIDHGLCILEKDSELYGDTEWLIKRLDAMPVLPDAFACANDYLAIHLMAALKKKGLNIPTDVMVTGFDGSNEASIIEPTLTTAQIPSAEIGRLAASLLISRIQSSSGSYYWTYVKTTPLQGESTR